MTHVGLLALIAKWVIQILHHSFINNEANSVTSIYKQFKTVCALSMLNE